MVEFQSIKDVELFIKKMANTLKMEDTHYDELIWFTSVNYTTQTEYLGELLICLKTIRDDRRFEKFKPDIVELIRTIQDTLQLQG